jgi:hypothetical protein
MSTVKASTYTAQLHDIADKSFDYVICGTIHTALNDSYADTLQVVE